MISISARFPRFWSIARSIAVTLMLLGGVGAIAATGHRHYPIQHWLFWRYAGYWLGTLTLAAGWLGVGHLLVRRVFRVRFPLHAHLAVSFTIGVFAYQLLLYILGAAQAYHPITFFAVPILPVALVSLPVYRDAKKLWRKLKTRRARPIGLGLIAAIFGLVGLAMVYFSILTPENIQFDARWKHLGLAEDMVVHGGIRRFPEGWVFSARPHSSSFLYAWAFLLPKARLFDQMVLSAHIEFTIFLFSTWFGVPALVRRLVPGADPRWVWAARFLFPGVFLYDSSLSGGADHIGAAFAIPLALVLFRVLRDARLGPVVLLCALISGAAIVKETIAIMLVPFPFLLMVGKMVAEIVKRLRGKSERSLGEVLAMPWLALLAGLVFTAPLWATNFVMYGDPFYPLLGRFLKPRPWSEAAAYRLAHGYLEGKMWAPTRDLEGLGKTFKALFTFSFVPNDWGKFHRGVPVFGSLYTLSLAPLLFLKRTRRIWLMVGWVVLAMIAWYSVHHQDRYLQGIVPFMAAITAAVLILVWRQCAKVVRVALGLLVGLQIVWGGDVYFIQTHVHAKSVIKKVVDLLSSGHEKKYDERFDVQKSYQELGKLVPDGGRVLLHLYHEHHTHLGLRREAVLDSYLWQFGIEYDRAAGPEENRQMLRNMGVTHVFAAPDKKPDGVWSIAADIQFWELVDKHLLQKKKTGGGVFGKLPEKPLPPLARNLVAVLTCHGAPPRGLFKLEDLRVLPYGPAAGKFPKPQMPGTAEIPALVADAGWAVIEEACFKEKDKAKEKPPELLSQFEPWLERKKYGKFPELAIWRRRGR